MLLASLHRIFIYFMVILVLLFLLKVLLFYFLLLDRKSFWNQHLHIVWSRGQDTFFFFPFGYPVDPASFTFPNSLVFLCYKSGDHTCVYLFLDSILFHLPICVFSHQYDTSLTLIDNKTYYEPERKSYRFVLLQDGLGYTWLFAFHYTFSINFPIFTQKNLLQFWLGLH